MEGIATQLKSEADISALVRANRRLYKILNNYLYQHNVQFSESTALSWAAENGRVSTTRRLLENGANPYPEPGRDAHLHVEEPLPLWKAASNGHEAIVRLLFENGASDNSTRASHIRKGTLVAAARNGHDSIVEMVFETCTDPVWHASFKGSPIVRFAIEGGASTTRLFLDRGVDLNQVTLYGRMAIFWAAEKGHEAVLQLILERNFDPHCLNHNVGESDTVEDLLNDAARRHSEHFVKHVLDYGVNIDTPDRYNGETALFYAAKHDCPAAAKHLLARGASAHVRNWDSQTPIIMAVSRGSVGVLLVLIEHGVELNSIGMDGHSLLSLAIDGGEPEVARLLLEHGADIDKINGHGLTALSYAARREQFVEIFLEYKPDLTLTAPLAKATAADCVNILPLLLEAGADINHVDPIDGTPLMAGIIHGKRRSVKFLLDHGARADAKGEDGRTPISVAVLRGYAGIVDDLLAAGVVDLAGATGEGRALLFEAAKTDKRLGVEILLKRGIEVDIRDADGRTPLSWAAQHGHGGAFMMLLKHGADIDAKDHQGLTVRLWLEQCPSTQRKNMLRLLGDFQCQRGIGAMGSDAHCSDESDESEIPVSPSS